jgi:hypothetical protein
LYIADLVGKNRLRLASNVWSFQFINNGKYIAYTTVEDLDTGRPQSTVVKVRIDGKTRKTLVEAEDGLYTLIK